MSDIITEPYLQIKHLTEAQLINCPMAESYEHALSFVYLTYVLLDLFSDKDDCLVAADMRVYYDQDNPTLCVAPDIMIIHGVTKPELEQKDMPSYKAWEQDGKYPDFIIEITSPSTQIKDRKTSKLIYEKIFKTSEYFIFDPKKPSLEGFKLVEDKYELLKVNINGRYKTQELGWNVEIGIEEGEKAIFQDGQRLLPYTDIKKERNKALQEKDKALQEKDRTLKRLEQKDLKKKLKA